MYEGIGGFGRFVSRFHFGDLSDWKTRKSLQVSANEVKSAVDTGGGVTRDHPSAGVTAEYVDGHTGQCFVSLPTVTDPVREEDGPLSSRYVTERTIP